MLFHYLIELLLGYVSAQLEQGLSNILLGYHVIAVHIELPVESLELLVS